MNDFIDDGQPGGDGGNVGPGGTGQNPAWNEFLQIIPEDLHEQVTPLLQKWDQGVNNRFEKIHSEYAPYKPFKEQDIPPDTLNMGISILNLMQENPEYVWKTLGEHYKFGAEPDGANSGQGQGEPEQEYQDPRYEQLQSNFDRLAQVVLAAEEQKRQQSADQALDAELSGLRKKYGDYDETYVLSRMQAGMAAEDAIKQFKELENRLAARGPRPMVLGSNSGGIPGNNTDVTKLSDQQRRSYAVQMLNAAKAERQNG